MKKAEEKERETSRTAVDRLRAELASTTKRLERLPDFFPKNGSTSRLCSSACMIRSSGLRSRRAARWAAVEAVARTAVVAEIKAAIAEAMRRQQKMIRATSAVGQDLERERGQDLESCQQFGVRHGLGGVEIPAFADL
jgi:hypothetical protein